MVVVGGRAPQNRWGSGSLQELDQPPIVAPVAKLARTLHDRRRRAGRDGRGLHRRPLARTAARSFVDVPMDEFFNSALRPGAGAARAAPASSPTPTRSPRSPGCSPRRAQPVLILGTDVWADGAEEAALRFVEDLGIPTLTNGMGRGVVPGGHPLLVTKARGAALGGADLVVVVGTPLDFRLGYGVFGGKDGGLRAAPGSCTSPTPPARSPATPSSPARSSGDLTAVLDGLPGRRRARRAGRTGRPGPPTLAGHREAAAAERDAELLGAEADPIHPARIYGELVPRLAEDAVVIGDGGDFVSFAGKYVEPKRPGGWLDPGPYGCLGAGLGAAIAARLARPSAQVVLLLGDGAAGFSLMDVDTLVRHDLPVVMVMGNNSAWGLEKGPMQMLYGYDVVADLAPRTPYDEVVKALGGAGETVTDPRQIGPALDRAFAAACPTSST